MGAIWAARDFCLFLLLLNSRQSAALPDIRGGTVVTVRACVCCVSQSWRVLLYARFKECAFVVSPVGILFKFSLVSKCVAIYKLLWECMCS